ncbi:farnesyl pyrophosphate synthase-like [Dreissena polymorpha]|uniref:Farnesyl pyrophosphate synthase n=1 Tax=Dreissena polymorpha TaxID=45954 RepID=A0A9D4S2L0_DREPO|nr:farnesyl pyrophosphate synthase-like [Dreissena polymorpha]KAH3887522.1 hypothetical protein DPMN_011539 [Dreissena polymorpha]
MDSAQENGFSPNKRSKLTTDLDEFDSLFPELVNNLLQSGLKDPEISAACEWFKEVLQYNVPHGKKNRGMFVVMAYKFLVPKPTEENIQLARVLGWCIEMLQAFFLVADDIMDQSLTRRGKPCWFRKENVGLVAVNDAVYLESCIYQLLKCYIRDQPYYVNILELFHEITHCTITGQCLDMTVSPPSGTVDFQQYTMEKYDAIVKWKTAFYSFCLPVTVAMFMAGIDDQEMHQKAKAILLKMGHYFQVQDDYLDCYGDPEVTGKIGTDIQDNKCSWLVITAIQRASSEQLAVLKENYGQSDKTKVKRVKELFDDLDLAQAFDDFEETSFSEIQTLIETSSGGLPQEMFQALVQKIYKRNK